MKIGNSSLLISNSTMFRKSYLFSAVRSPNPHSQTSPQTHTHTHYNANTLCGKQNHIQTATHKNSARTHTEYIYTHTHTHANTYKNLLKIIMQIGFEWLENNLITRGNQCARLMCSWSVERLNFNKRSQRTFSKVGTGELVQLGGFQSGGAGPLQGCLNAEYELNKMLGHC